MSVTNFTLTNEYLHELFEYNDGGLFWKKNGKKAGKISYLKYPYVRICLNYKKYQEHRLIFLMFNGYLPEQIDHINLVKHDNRIENLRESTASQNGYNTKPRNFIKNVSWYKRIGKWQVQLKVNQKTLHFGYFDSIELAEFVATEARNKYHGKFARHT